MFSVPLSHTNTDWSNAYNLPNRMMVASGLAGWCLNHLFTRISNYFVSHDQVANEDRRKISKIMAKLVNHEETRRARKCIKSQTGGVEPRWNRKKRPSKSVRFETPEALYTLDARKSSVTILLGALFLAFAAALTEAKQRANHMWESNYWDGARGIFNRKEFVSVVHTDAEELRVLQLSASMFLSLIISLCFGIYFQLPSRDNNTGFN